MLLEDSPLSSVAEESIAEANRLGGPQIKFVNPIKGYGLFAEKDYFPKDFITFYDGETRIGTRSEVDDFSGDYVINGRIGDSQKYYSIDGAKCFHMHNKGRFINDPGSAVDENVTAKFIPEAQKVAFYAKKIIAEGEEILWYYGPLYERPWLTNHK